MTGMEENRLLLFSRPCKDLKGQVISKNSTKEGEAFRKAPQDSNV